jgi:nucleotide-binding universal stress UspA family protein
VPAGSTGNALRIVVGVDGSPSSRAALRWAVGYAVLISGTVDAIMAKETPETDPVGGFGQMPAEVKEAEMAAEETRQALDAVISEEVKPDDRNQVRARVFEGRAAAALLKAADGADLLAVGNRGLGGFAEALLGSTSYYIAYHATCPVLIVRGDPSRVK